MYRIIKYIAEIVIMAIALNLVCPAAEQDESEVTFESLSKDTHDNLDEYLGYLGQQSTDGEFDGLDELLKNETVNIMGYDGTIRIPHTFSTKEINQIRWIESTKQNWQGLIVFKRMFNEFMGAEALMMPIDDISDECYVWFDIDNYRYVICWLAENEHINVLWMVGDDNLAEMAAVTTNNEQKENQKETLVTSGMENALKKADAYLDYMAFSYSGLYDQLKYDGFLDDEAQYAVDNCGADWKEQAKRKAEDYLEYSAFSKSGLIEQLEYDGFTHEQAVMGVEAVY